MDLSRVHERKMRATQRNMLRLIDQTIRKYKKRTQGNKEGKETKKEKQPANEKSEVEAEKKESHKSYEDETAEGSSSNTDCDQDRDGGGARFLIKTVISQLLTDRPSSSFSVEGPRSDGQKWT